MPLYCLNDTSHGFALLPATTIDSHFYHRYTTSYKEAVELTRFY